MFPTFFVTRPAAAVFSTRTDIKCAVVGADVIAAEMNSVDRAGLFGMHFNTEED
jgi:hypothetical protein